MSNPDTLRDALAEECRQYGASLVSHPVANGTIECTERAGELLLKAAAALAAEGQQPLAAVPPGWRIQIVSDGDVRLYGPRAGETWLLRRDFGGGFLEFLHRYFTAAARPQAQPTATPPTA